MIQTIEIIWRLPPKRMKIFYKLNENSDWISATEVFIREKTEKENNYYNTIYFKKPLICSKIKIAMNKILIKKNFSLLKVKFYNKNIKGLIRSPIFDKNKNFCWFLNTNFIRKNVPIYFYPCVNSINSIIGNEIFLINSNLQIKPNNYDLCIAYDKDNYINLGNCSEENKNLIKFNSDYSLSFSDKEEKKITIEDDSQWINLIDKNSEIIASSEFDNDDYKKENILDKNNKNYWMSNPGVKEVSLQILFRIKCIEEYGQICEFEGKYESKKIERIRINWHLEPQKFSIFIWNPGFAWKNVANFNNNLNKVTDIFLKNEYAAGIMIRINEGKLNEDENVSYGIKFIEASFSGYLLKLKNSENKIPMKNKFFDFEIQNFLDKKSNENYNLSYLELSKNYENSVNFFKKMKKNSQNLKMMDTNKNLNCGKLKNFGKILGQRNFEILKKYEILVLRKINNPSFITNLNKFGELANLDSIIGSNYLLSEKESILSIIKENEVNNSEEKEKNFDSNFLKNILIENLSNENTPNLIKSSTKLNENQNKRKIDLFQENTNIDIGSYENPVSNCVEIKQLKTNPLSGFYFIQPECSPEPIRVFCDFTLFSTAVDIHIFKDDSNLPTPDLSDLKIESFSDVREHCEKIGLLPIEIRNKETILRIYQLLISSGIDLNPQNFIPLGFDYSCKKGKCSDIYNSLNSQETLPIMNFFDEKENKSTIENKIKFAGFGVNDYNKLITFNEKTMKISGLICSTNITNKGQNLNKQIKLLNCNSTLKDNYNLLNSGGEFVANCPKNCQKNSTPVYGNDIYHIKSSICKAGIHSGELNFSGGKITIKIQKEENEYISSKQNGIRSKNLENDGDKSFIVFKYLSNCPKRKNCGKKESNKNEFSSFIENSEFEILKEKDSEQKKENSSTSNLISVILENINSGDGKDLQEKIKLLKVLLENKENEKDKKKEGGNNDKEIVRNVDSDSDKENNFERENENELEKELQKEKEINDKNKFEKNRFLEKGNHNEGENDLNNISEIARLASDLIVKKEIAKAQSKNEKGDDPHLEINSKEKQNKLIKAMEKMNGVINPTKKEESSEEKSETEEYSSYSDPLLAKNKETTNSGINYLHNIINFSVKKDVFNLQEKSKKIKKIFTDFTNKLKSSTDDNQEFDCEDDIENQINKNCNLANLPSKLYLIK